MSGRAKKPSGGVPPAGSTGTSTAKTSTSSSPVTNVGSATARVFGPASTQSSHRRFDQQRADARAQSDASDRDHQCRQREHDRVGQPVRHQVGDVAADDVGPPGSSAACARSSAGTARPAAGRGRGRPGSRPSPPACASGPASVETGSPGHQPDDQEDQHRRQQQHQQCRRQPPHEVAGHAASLVQPGVAEGELAALGPGESLT